MSKQRYRVLLIVWALLFSIVSAVGPNSKVIYGEDTRRDFYELSAKEKSFGISTVAILIGEQVLTQQEDYTWLITPTKSAQELWGWCPTERFASQPVASSAEVFCSGFLISSSPSWIVTAAHCTERPLDQYWVVFNFHQVSALNTELRFSPEDVYWVKSLVAVGEPTAGAGDWGVLELDRDVVGHVPYSQIRADITVGEALVLVGHPYGLPKKTDTDGEVKNVTLTEIRGFVDSYGGNSGSPIFDSKGALVGILVGGAPDFTVNEGCEISNVCPGGQGCSSLGEHIVPICVLANDSNIAPLGLCDQIKLVFQGNSASGNPFTIIHAVLILLGVVLLV